jgi:phage tail protein X
MTEYIEYITKDGDRWCNIAYIHYGDDPDGVHRIIKANPTVPIIPLLSAGFILRIPLLSKTQQAKILSDKKTAPWLRKSPQ